MLVTRVIFNKAKHSGGALANCAVVLDDCLMLSGIRLYKEKGEYYLILPSKQDVYSSISTLNKDVSIKYPKNRRSNCDKDNKRFEEFYHPLTKEFYSQLLDNVVKGYSSYKEEPNSMKGSFSYRPK